MFGVVTAVFGGVLRDIVCNEIPSAFSDHRPYAVCSFFGGRVLMASQALQAPAWVGSVGAAGVAAGLRMLAFARPLQRSTSGQRPPPSSCVAFWSP